MSGWPPKDWRALLALIFSVLGAVIMTTFVWWGFAQLLPGGDPGWSMATEADRAQTLRWVLWIAVATIGAVLLGLGMAINRRSFKGNLGGSGFDFQGGDGNDPEVEAARRVEGAARTERRNIEAEADDKLEIPRPAFGVDEPQGGA